MFEWDQSKAKKNQLKHGVSFADTFAIFEDPNAVTLDDPSTSEQRYITIGNGCFWTHPRGGLHMAGR
jgi:uncharacterized DUF497 family protein